MKKILPIVLLSFFSVLTLQLQATVYTVTDISTDNNTGAGTSGTFRYCLEQAKGSPGPHTINFNIAGVAPFIINMNNQYDIGNQNITIDATTQPGWTAGQPVVILRGNTGLMAFNIYSNTIVVRGLIFQNLRRGIELNGGSNHIITGCWFGIDYAGTSKASVSILEQGILNNGRTGLVIGGTTVAERNILSGCVNNTYSDGVRRGAIHLTNSSHNNTIIGNYIGPNATGNGAIGNGIGEPVNQHGIYISNSSQTANPIIIENNVISGNAGNGIWADGNCFGLRIRSNIIGMDAAGMARMGNKAGGIRIDGGNSHYIGYDGNDATGTAATKRNIISGNGYAADSRPCRGTWCGNPCTNCDEQYDGTLQCGIYFNDVDNSFISSNYIGLKSNGIDTCSNLYAGVKFENGSTGNTIGGITSDYRNVIGGNGFDYLVVSTPFTNYVGHGIQLNHAAVTNTTIQNNYVGIGADGVTPAGNRQDGISLLGSKNNTITNNVISCNAWGIFMQNDFQGSGNANQPSGNNIHSNYIGTDYTGNSTTGTAGALLGNGVRTTPLDDDGGGIGLQHGSYSNNIGTTTGAVNVISGNRNGVIIRYTGDTNGGPANNNTIQNNYIGVGADGTTALANSENGVYFSGAVTSNTIGGNAANTANYISNNGQHGISFNGAVSNNIRNNFVGLNTAGAAAGNLQNGIFLYNGSQNNTIGGSTASVRNVISSNGANGIFVNEATTTGNIIRGNYIGLSTDGSTDMGNAANGIYVLNVTAASSATATTIGGLAAADGNIISGNNNTGILIENSAYTPVQSNRIGTNATGTAAVGNGSHGLYITGTSGNGSIINNLVSGNGANGVFGFGNAISITDCGTHTIQGNYCGTDAAGTTAIPNLNAGLSTTNSNSNTVGGTPAQRNIFSGNDDVGVYLNNSDNSIFTNNYIGVGSTVAALGNVNDGVVLENGSSGNRFGGVTGNEGNIIASNGGNGITISGATSNNNSIHQNKIYCNTLRGIELNDTGNDNPSFDRPAITVASTATMLYGTSEPGATIEIFGIGAAACATCPDDPERIQGRYFLGFVTADVSGDWEYPFTGSRDTIVVTASVLNTNTGHNTSEFSACAPLCIGGTTAIAGLDQPLCDQTSVTMNANAPNTGDGETGTWTQYSGPAVSFVDDNDPQTQVNFTDVVKTGTYVFVWSISTGICPPSSDTVSIINSAVPTTADAGSNIDVCATTANITGNTPTVGNGAWSFVGADNGASIGNDLLASTTVNDLAVGTVTLRWTISNGACTPSTSDITVTRDETPTTADAGSNIDVCATTANITGNTPTVGNGAWSFVGADNGASIGNDLLASTTVNNLAVGTVTLRWTISNGSCTPSTSDITVTRDETPTTADAGSNIDVCATTANITGNTPTVGNGAWSFVGADNGATIGNDLLASTTVNDLAIGTVTLRWTISNGSCTPSTSDITVTRDETPTTADAGSNIDVCATTANITGNTPTIGSGAWSFVGADNGATIGNDLLASTTVNDLAIGTVTLRWTISNGSCTPSTSDITVTRDETPTTADAGSNIDVCATTAAITGNTPAVGTGTWSFVGSANGASINDNTQTSTTVENLAVGSVTLRWTISNGSCTPSTSDITITRGDAPTTANAGSAIDSCVNTTVKLSGNAPASGETGTWSVQSGTATIPDASDPAATITVTSSPAVLRWEITNGICAASHDDVTIAISSMPSTSDAGADEPTLCADNTTLNATPAGNGTGHWLIISGTGTITDDLNPASPVTGISTGTLSLEWVISSGSCPASRDTVDIVRQPDLVLADAGADRPTCATSVVLAGNDPGTGYTGEWSPLTLTFSDVNDPNATVSGLAPGANTITWTITGPCGNSSEDVIITQGNSTVAITATASKDTICAGSPSEMSAIVTGTSATPLTYIWTSSDNSLSTSYEAGTTTNLEVTPSAAGWVKYYVSVVDDNGCGNGAVDSVYSIGSQALKIPNLITPNGDSRNDCLEILDTDGYNIVPGSVYQIYNRWGEAVYKNDNYANGDFCGSDLADGMYYFYLKTSCDNREFKGWLHILSNTGASIK